MIEINHADEIDSVAPTTDLAIAIPSSKVDGAVIDRLNDWLISHGAGVETLKIRAKWIYWGRLPALDVASCPDLRSLWVRGLNISPQLLTHQKLQHLFVMQCLLEIEEGGLRIGGEHLPSLATCSFSETRTGADYLEVADAQHLTNFGLGIDPDYADGQDPVEYFFLDCPVLERASISVPYDITVEVSGDLPALVEVSIHTPEREHAFEHELCSRPLLRSTVHYYDDETNKEPIIPIDEWDGKGSIYSFGYWFTSD